MRYGPDLTLHVCHVAAREGVPLVFYGGSSSAYAYPPIPAANAEVRPLKERAGRAAEPEEVTDWRRCEWRSSA